MAIFEFIFGFIPLLVWVFVLGKIINAAKKSVRNSAAEQRNSAPNGNFKKSDWDGVKRLQNANTINSKRERQFTQPRRTQFRSKNEAKTEISGTKKLFSSFGNTDYDVYKDDHKDGVGKLTNGYNISLARDSHAMKKSAHMQYSHTYDGHEPWDKCMPKEKDPWDKDFYRGN